MASISFYLLIILGIASGKVFNLRGDGLNQQESAKKAPIHKNILSDFWNSFMKRKSGKGALADKIEQTIIDPIYMSEVGLCLYSYGLSVYILSEKDSERIGDFETNFLTSSLTNSLPDLCDDLKTILKEESVTCQDTARKTMQLFNDEYIFIARERDNGHYIEDFLDFSKKLLSRCDHNIMKLKGKPTLFEEFELEKKEYGNLIVPLVETEVEDLGISVKRRIYKLIAFLEGTSVDKVKKDGTATRFIDYVSEEILEKY